MSQIQVSGLTFYYEGSYDMIFDQVSFRIDTDWKLGFIGRNGKGKTTFLRLLMGKEEYRGSIHAAVEFDYFPYEIKDRSRDTIDIVEGLQPDYELWRLCMELNLLQVDAGVLYRPFETLSNGEQTKVMLALLFSRENRFLLIDEPTNHLDCETREMVKEYLASKKGFIMVSHDRELLDACIDHVLAIQKEDIVVCQGNFTDWWENKQKQDAHELAENERLKKDIGRLKESARRTAQWADAVEATKIGHRDPYEKSMDLRPYIGEKSRRMQMRRKNLERRQKNAIDEKAKLLKNLESPESLKLMPLSHYKKILVHMEAVSFSYPVKGAETDCAQPLRAMIQELKLKVEAGERIALTGRNGCGKSTVLKLILGALTPQSGRIEIAGGLVLSYVPQDTSFLQGSLEDFIGQSGLDESLFKAMLRKLDFERVQFEKQMQEYSAGQKKKVLLARSLCERAHLYIWDEPLNFIDIFSRMQIEELLLTYKPTMIFVEHDRVFVDKIATRQIPVGISAQ